MKEADVRLKLHHALQFLQYWPKHDQDARKYPVTCQRCHHVNWFTVTPEIKGLPDTNGRHPRFPSPLIEVKVVKSDEQSFAFSSISSEQRKYLTSWAAEGGGAYICIGKIVPADTKEKIREILVIPWDSWIVCVEETHEKSIPWDYELYETLPSLPRPSDLKSIVFDQWYLTQNGSDWHFKPEHPLYVQPEIDVPFYKRVKEK